LRCSATLALVAFYDGGDELSDLPGVFIVAEVFPARQFREHDGLASCEGGDSGPWRFRAAFLARLAIVLAPGVVEFFLVDPRAFDLAVAIHELVHAVQAEPLTWVAAEGSLPSP
jgi:hypothetical protein